MRFCSPAFLFTGSILAFTLTGCTIQNIASPSPAAGVAIEGRVMGGQQPLTGATILVVQAGDNTPNSTQILNGAGTVTDANGAFSVTGSYTCTPNRPVYLLARGGNPGLAAGTNNAGIALMAVLGSCPAGGGDFSATLPHVVINEVTTVSAVYALSAFMTGPTAVLSNGTNGGATGLAAAFATAANLTDVTSGAAYATTPAGNGTVPTATINTMANIIAACINTNGAVTPSSFVPPGITIPASACYTLYNNAADRSGTVPSDTVTALLNIAKNPSQHQGATGSFTVSSLYGLTSAQAPFQPSLASQPNDFTLEMTYTGGGLSGASSRPRTVAIDSLGNVWTANTNSVSLFNNLGAAVSPATGYTGLSATLPAPALSSPVAIAVNANNQAVIADQGLSLGGGSVRALDTAGVVQNFTAGLTAPADVAVDASGSYWIPGVTFNQLYRVTAGAATPVVFTGNGMSSPTAVAVDMTGTVWVANQSGNTESVFKADGTALGNFATGDTGVQASNAVDSMGNVFTTNVTSNANNTTGVSKQSSTGTVATGSPYNDLDHVSHANSVAIDGANNVWVANSGQTPMYELNDAGASLSGFSGYVSDVVPSALAIDGSGNVWFRNAQDSTLRELVGAAASTATPIVSQLPTLN